MRTSIGLGLGLMMMTAACGGGGGGSVGLDDLPDELERAQCEGMVACGTFPDVETCLAAQFVDHDDDIKTLRAGVEAGTITYDAEQAAACLDFFRDAQCRFSASVDSDDIEAACDDVFVGHVAEGGACVDDEECVDDGECVPSPDCLGACCVGECGPAQGGGGGTVPIDGDCSEADCVDGAYCHNDFMTGTAICEAEVAAGGECNDFDACGPGLWCFGFDFETPGTCDVPPDRGESCADAPLCDRIDDYCDPADMTCKPRKGPGETCTPDTNECVDYATCLDGTCVAYPGEGEDCSTIQDCLGDLECVAGACAAPADEPGCDIPPP